MPITDSAVWGAEGRVASAVPFDRVFETAAEHGRFAWVDLVDPTEAELELVASELELHHLLVEDVIARGQRSKFETYGSTGFCVVHRVEALDSDPQETPLLREMHAIVDDRCIVTVSWSGDGALERVRSRLAAGVEGLRLTPHAVLYAVIDDAADAVERVATTVHEQIESLEDAFFREEQPPTVDIYRAMRRVLTLQRAADPMSGVIGRVTADADEGALELRRHLRDVDDHARRTASRLAGDRDLLAGLLQLASARVAERQNEELRIMTERQLVQNDQMKKVTSWAAILFAPTLIAGVYGMNFRTMPELHWVLGYPFAVALMVVFSASLYVAFKRNDWL